MPSPDALISWFDLTVDTLPETPLTSDETANPSFLTLLDEPPVGITQLKMRYRTIPLNRCGPKGWTYFPVDTDGTRLARVSYQSPQPNAYITAMVKLIDYEDGPETDTWSVSKYAIVTIDNLNAHGRVDLRDPNNPNTRRKVCIYH